MPFLVYDGPVILNVAVEGSGPLIICVHGWPELSYASRHQVAHFSALRCTLAANDVRGKSAARDCRAMRSRVEFRCPLTAVFFGGLETAGLVIA
jgi:hypothetical protein